MVQLRPSTVCSNSKWRQRRASKRRSPSISPVPRGTASRCTSDQLSTPVSPVTWSTSLPRNWAIICWTSLSVEQPSAACLTDYAVCPQAELIECTPLAVAYQRVSRVDRPSSSSTLAGRGRVDLESPLKVRARRHCAVETTATARARWLICRPHKAIIAST